VVDARNMKRQTKCYRGLQLIDIAICLTAELIIEIEFTSVILWIGTIFIVDSAMAEPGKTFSFFPTPLEWPVQNERDLKN